MAVFYRSLEPEEVLYFGRSEEALKNPPYPCLAAVRRLALSLAGVSESVKYDGSPVWKVRGVFLAGLAMHPSAEPATLVVRTPLDTREGLLDDAPATYYLTPYYRRYPLVLVRLAHIEPDPLGELLAISWRMALRKSR